ncbi:MAG TPA: GAF domain-containing protein, partial [Gemmatimonadaceae bacterium]|nr:GAF domain-containing protein [Gemmatimonadaceae bacterium]
MSFRPAPTPASPGTDLAALALLGDAVSDPVILAGAELVITHANPAAGRLFGAASGGLEGRRLDELFPEAVRGTVRHAAREGGDFVVELEGAASHALAGRRCRLRRSGDQVVLVVAPDAIPSVSDVVRQLNQTLEFERIVHLVARHAMELLRASRAAVFVLDDDSLVAVGSAGAEVLPAGTRLPLDGTFSGTAIRALRPMRLTDTRTTGARWPRLAHDGARDPRPNALAAPLVIGGRPIGAVCAAGRVDGDFDAADERLLAKLADHAAVAVENARLYSAAARTARHASILAETAHEIAHHVTPDAMHAGVARIARQALRADGVCVYLADDERQSVELAHREGTLSGLEPGPRVRELWAGSIENAARSGTPHFLPDIGTVDLRDCCPAHGVLPGAELAAGALA